MGCARASAIQPVEQHRAQPARTGLVDRRQHAPASFGDVRERVRARLEDVVPEQAVPGIALFDRQVRRLSSACISALTGAPM